MARGFSKVLVCVLSCERFVRVGIAVQGFLGAGSWGLLGFGILFDGV